MLEKRCLTKLHNTSSLPHLIKCHWSFRCLHPHTVCVWPVKLPLVPTIKLVISYPHSTDPRCPEQRMLQMQPAILLPIFMNPSYRKRLAVSCLIYFTIFRGLLRSYRSSYVHHAQSRLLDRDAAPCIEC
jgi:hypothetical protein